MMHQTPTRNTTDSLCPNLPIRRNENCRASACGRVKVVVWAFLFLSLYPTVVHSDQATQAAEQINKMGIGGVSVKVIDVKEDSFTDDQKARIEEARKQLTDPTKRREP